MQLKLEVDRGEVAGGEDLEFVARLTTEEPRTVRVFAAFDLKVNEETRSNDWVEVYAGPIQVGVNRIPVAIEVPNGPFDYMGKSVKVRWRLVSYAESPGLYDAVASERIRVVPGALAMVADGYLEEVPERGRAPKVAIAIAAFCITIFVGAYAGWIAGLAFAGAIVVGFALSQAQPRDSFGTGFSAELSDDAVPQGQPVNVRIRRTITNDDREVDLRAVLFIQETGVTYENGRPQQTSPVVFEQTFEGALSPTESETDITIAVPTGHPGSFSLGKSATVRWGVRVQVLDDEKLTWQIVLPLTVGTADPVLVDSNPVA